MIRFLEVYDCSTDKISVCDVLPGWNTYGFLCMGYAANFTRRYGGRRNTSSVAASGDATTRYSGYHLNIPMFAEITLWKINPLFLIGKFWPWYLSAFIDWVSQLSLQKNFRSCVCTPNELLSCEAGPSCLCQLLIGFGHVTWSFHVHWLSLLTFTMSCHVQFSLWIILLWSALALSSL